MKIAVASNDGVSISKHFGRTNRFTVFEIRNDEILAEESRGHSLRSRRGPLRGNQAGLDGLVPSPRRRDCRARGLSASCCAGAWVGAAPTELVRQGVNPLVIVEDLSPRVAVEHYLAGTLKPASGFCRRQQANAR